MKQEVILVFDIGKTNKKALLFNRGLQVIEEEEWVFEEVTDEDGFPCDDADRLESWLDRTLSEYLAHPEYALKGVNFSTYGATLVMLPELVQSNTYCHRHQSSAICSALV